MSNLYYVGRILLSSLLYTSTLNRLAISHKIANLQILCTVTNIFVQTLLFVKNTNECMVPKLKQVNIHCGAKKLHRLIFAISLSNQAIF